MEIEQTVRTYAAQQPQQQQTLTGRIVKCLFTFIFYAQLTLISIFVIFLTQRGLVFTKSPTFNPNFLIWYDTLLSSVAISGFLSLAWNFLFLWNIQVTVKSTLWFTPILTISVGIFLIVYHQHAHSKIGVPLVICSIISALYNLFTTKKHKFTIKMMSNATGILPARTRLISVISTIISLLYSGFLVNGIFGATATATRTRFDILFITILIINLAWTMQVLKNIQLVAVSKATYVYFKRHEFMNACNALCATLKHNLGNVCVGSTLVPLIVLFRGSIRCAQRSDDDQKIYTSTRGCYCMANRIILWGNRYGFVHVGAHNKGFVQASSDVWRKFRTVDGFEQLIDFDITSTICFFSAVGIGSVSALYAGMSELLIENDHLFELTIYAFIIGYFVGRVSSAWLQACVMGYYVAYSEDPQSDNFDDTIPHRIEQQRIEKAEREAEPNRVLTDDEYFRNRVMRHI